jgi:hypothetical protein
LQGFEMDEQSYLQVIYQELLDRRSKGADAEAEIAELERYVASDPRLQLVEPSRSFTERAQAKARRSWARTRSRWIGNRAGYKAPGALNGFGDILGAADFVARSIREPSLVPVRAQTA